MKNIKKVLRIVSLLLEIDTFWCYLDQVVVIVNQMAETAVQIEKDIEELSSLKKLMNL